MQSGASDRVLCQRRQLRVWILVLLGILATLLLISTVVLAILYGIERNKTNVPENNDDLCLTPYCVEAANYLLESMDEGVNPCENFYEFTCGTWLKNARIPNDASSQNHLRILEDELEMNIVDLLSTSPSNSSQELKAIVNSRRLYNSCIDENQIETEGVNTILTLVNTVLGGWPILEGSKWNSSLFNITQLLLKLNEHSNFAVYLVLTLTNDKNSSINGIRIGQGTLGLGDRSYYTTTGDNSSAMAYQDYIRDLAQALNNDIPINGTDVTAIFEFEKEISKYHWTLSEQHARDTETVYTTMGNLTTKLNTTFNFDDYLRRLYGLVNITLIGTDLVTISELRFLRNVSALIEQRPSRTVQNYLIWRFLMNQAKNMPKKYRNIRQTFLKISQGINTEPSRTITCANYVNNIMGLAVSKLYIKKYFDGNARNQSLEMINNIRESFIGMINQSTWMDSQSKTRAIEKARAVGGEIGYPENLDNDRLMNLEKNYAGVRHQKLVFLAVPQPFYYNLANLRSLREPVNRKSWSDIPPTTVNAFYDPSRNQNLFPAGILQTPYFNKDAPKYLNYGAIGVVVAHEITHGFDNIGRQYDKDGNKIPWWTNETVEAFTNRTKCIIEQYSNYTVPQANDQIKGQQTQGEDIADNGGLKEAFFAYQKWSQNHKSVDKNLPGLTKYTAEQLFFISYGCIWCDKQTDQSAKNQILLDVHSPARFRIIGPTSNFAEFDRVFGCKPGQGNSRVNKCTVW